MVKLWQPVFGTPLICAWSSLCTLSDIWLTHHGSLEAREVSTHSGWLDCSTGRNLSWPDQYSLPSHLDFPVCWESLRFDQSTGLFTSVRAILGLNRAFISRFDWNQGLFSWDPVRIGHWHARFKTLSLSNSTENTLAGCHSRHQVFRSCPWGLGLEV